MKIPLLGIELRRIDPAELSKAGTRPVIYSRTIGSGRGDFRNYKIGVDTLFTAYRNSGDIFGCVRELSEGIGSSGYHFENVQDPEGQPDKSSVLIAEEVLNGLMPFGQLKSRMARDWGVAGNSYIATVKNEADTRIIGLQPADPRTMAMISDKYGDIHGWVQRSRSGVDAEVFEADEILHWKNGTDPWHELFGLSPLEPVLWEARTDIAAMISNYFFFENNAMPSAQFILDDKLNDDQVKAAVEEIKSQFSGPQNSHKPAALQGVKDIKVINISQKDMEFIVGRKFTTEKICAAYGVPKAVLGYTEDVNYSNAELMFKKFIEGTITPAEESLADFINESLFPLLGIDDKIRFEFNPHALETQSMVEERALREYQSGALTLRQYKKKTGMEVTEEDESNPAIDSYIIHQGAGAILLESIVDGDAVVNPNDEESAKRFLALLQQFRNQPPKK
jgi:HK97 family phage portal protein